MRFLIILLSILAMPFVSNAQTNQLDRLPACEIQAPPTAWGLTEGCYKKDKLIATNKGDIYFWRLSDDERAAHGGETSDTPAAALVLETGERQELIKGYCPNYCWVMANEDPLPQIEDLGDAKYAIWAPDNRLAHRHGTNGRIELLDINTLSLTPISEELDARYARPPMEGIGKIGECRYLVFSAIEFVTTTEPEAVPGGYTVVEYPYQQSLTENCQSLGYYGLNDPDTVVPELKKKLGAEMEWLVKFDTHPRVSGRHTSVPDIMGMSYDNARMSLLENGWKPKLSGPPELTEDDDRILGNGELFWARGYKEIEACSGSGTALCAMNFENEQGKVLRVITEGEEWQDEQARHAKVIDWSLTE